MIRFFENVKTRTLLLVLGTLLLINGIISTILESTSLGVILTIFFGICLLVCGFFKNTKAIVIIKSFILMLLVLLISYSIFIYAYGTNDTATYNEDAVVVLGTVVIGDKPSTDLKNRLDATIKYHKENPNALIIVTGGQGTDENDTEASVMFKDLINAGLPKEMIIMEGKATSTAENFDYSKEILNSKGFDVPKITYISNDFHLFRAGALAKNSGFVNATHYHGKTPWHMVIPNGLRESIVTIKMWLID